MDLDNKIATRESFGKALVELGKENKDVVVLTADLAGATKTSLFEKEFPDRFINVGIAEQNLIGISAGLATTGKIPFASTFAMFAAGRAYDQIRNSVAYPKLNVKICGTHAGVTVGEDGATHQMLEDLSLMRSIPNMTVLCPSDDTQTKWVIKEMAKFDGTVYIRLARVATPIIYDENQKFEIGKMVQIGDGTDATIFATGVEVAETLKAKEELEKENINIRVVDVHTIKPIDREMIVKCAKETKKIITIEDHSIIGGLGTAICEVLSEEYPTKVIRMGMNDKFGKSGKAEQLLKYFKLDSQAIIEKVKE